MDQVELHLPPRVQYVGLARQIVKAAARQASMSDERLADLEIAVSEATTNAILAHHRVQHDPAIVVAFEVRAEDFQVEIRDTRPGFDFDPTALGGVQDRDWQAEGGLGVTLIRGLADQVDFLRARGMRVVMSFKLNGQREAADA